MLHCVDQSDLLRCFLWQFRFFESIQKVRELNV
jgi:hypothetical protein